MKKTRRQVDEALRLSEELYRDLFENANDVIYTHDLSGRFTSINGAAERLLGYTRGEALAMNIDDVVAPEYRGLARAMLEGKLAGGSPTTYEIEVMARGSGRMTLEVSTRLIYHNRAAVAVQGIARDITARRAAEARFRSLLEFAPDAVAIVDGEGRVVLVNAQTERLFGYRRDELIGQPVETLVPDRYRSGHAARRSRYFSGPAVRPMGAGVELYGRRKDGTEFPVEISLGPLETAEGILAISAIRDITERRRSEEAGQRLVSIVESSEDAIISYSLDGAITSWNPAATRMYGYSAGEAIGASVVMLHPSESLDELSTILERIGRGEHIEHFETVRVRKDGGPIHVGLTVSPIRNALGSIVGVSAIASDITRRRQAEAALREAEERYHSLFENAVEGIFRTDSEGRLTTANPALARMLGYDSPEELIGVFVDPERRREAVEEAPEELRRLVAEHGVVTGYEREARHHDGSTLWVSENVRAIRDGSGRLLGYEGSIRDISERKRAEEARRRLNRELEIKVRELEKRSREMTLLIEMGELLQASATVEEALSIVARIAPDLFPGDAGALYLITSSVVLEAAVEWGEVPADPLVFGREECWALRRRRIHSVRDMAGGLLCAHVRPGPASYVCAPMVARGEAIGVLHLVQTSRARLTESLELLAATAAEHFALSFANLKLHETLRIQSIRDPLTGLFNRRFMEESLARELQRAARHQRSVAVMMVDLDRFKLVNDTLGHQAGDGVLREVGNLLAANSRGGDISCRYGGDEFILILPESSSSDTLRRAEHLLEAVRLLELGREPGGRITASIGIASFAEHGTTAEAVLRAADKALYRAKAEGRDRVALAQ